MRLPFTASPLRQVFPACSPVGARCPGTGNIHPLHRSPMVGGLLFPLTDSCKRSLCPRPAKQGGSCTKQDCFTSVEGIEFLPRIAPSYSARGYSSDEARKEAERCLQCECMECVKVCEYLAEFKGYPKTYIRRIYNNLSIVMGQRQGNKLINSCSLCGLCKEVCPEGLHMGEVCKAARNLMVEQGKMPPSAHEFALRDMEFSNSDKAALVRHQPGTTASASVFFPGCQLSGSSPFHVKRRTNT